MDQHLTSENLLPVNANLKVTPAYMNCSIVLQPRLTNGMQECSGSCCIHTKKKDLSILGFRPTQP